MDIAIVGAACRLPGAPSLSALADLLFSGRDAVTEIPDDRFTKRFYLDTDQQQAGKTYTFAAGVVDGVDQFDAAFFGMSPRETMHTDPQQRLLLELAYEALEDAGLTPSQVSGTKTAVYVGCSAWDYSTLGIGDISLMDTHSMQGLSLSSTSNRLSFVFNLLGPSMTIDTACSSALVALHMACESIRRGESDQALVGAVNLLLSPQSFVGFSRASMLSPTGRCHAFDARADGYVRSEGGGVVVLKSLADALAAGDEIRAIIKATGVNSDGHTSSFSVPGRDAQRRLLEATYASAGVSPDDLSYLEAHGTGTPVGDPIEAGALGEGLAQKRSKPLPIGSVKSNLGHLEAASGMAGLLKLLTILERRAIPPSLHCETPNPNIPFEELNLALTPQSRPLEAGDKGVLLGLNSFGFGGTNAHAVLAAPETVAATVETADSVPPLLLSAKTEAALQDLARAWAPRLRQETASEAAALARAAARRRDAFEHRLVLRADAPATMALDLEAWLSGGDTAAIAGRAATGGLAFIYSGNGSQWAGMGADAYAHSSVFRDIIAEIDSVFEPMAGWSLAAAFHDGVDEVAFADTQLAQPLLFALQVGVTAALRAEGVKPDAVVGHSVGEAAAAWASGALTLAQATEVIYHRSRLQQTTHGQGGMAVLNVATTAAEPLLARVAPDLHIAAINGPTALTVAGSDASLEALQATARDERLAYVRLPLQYAFHSPAMDPIQRELLEALKALKPGAPSIPMFSTTTGDEVSAGELNADYWWRNVRAPVRFGQAADRLVEHNVRIFIEIGPRPTLLSYVQSVLKAAGVSGVTRPSLTAEPTLRDPFPEMAAQAFVDGVDIRQIGAFDGSTPYRRLPTYPWQRQRHWGKPTVEARLTMPMEDHPLLGFRSDDRVRAWTNVLSATRMPWLTDHQVNAVPVLPGAAMLDMAFAAAKARHPDALGVEVTDVEFLRPLLVEGARELAFEMTSDEMFEISSRPRLSNEDRVVYARGRLAVAPALKPLFQRAEGSTPASMPVETLYERANNVFLNYGPEFRPISQVHVFNPDEIEVDFAGPETRSDLEPGWLVDPRLLDGALQQMMASRSYDVAKPGDGVLPWRFGRVRLFKPGARIVRAAGRVTRVGPKAHSADFAVMDETGEIVAEMLDCWFMRLRPGRADAPERTFQTVRIPTARQPEHDGVDLPAPSAATKDVDTSQVLAQAFATAAAFEALSGLSDDGLLSLETLAANSEVAPEQKAMFDEIMHWMEEDGLAHSEALGWRLAPESGLPSAAEIWQSLMFDEPAAIADIALAGVEAVRLIDLFKGASVPGGGAASLREQLFQASPAALAGADALIVEAQAIMSAWPKDRPLRVGLFGEPTPSLVRALIAQGQADGLMIRFALVGGASLSSTAEAELKGLSGSVVVRTADELDAETRFDLIIGALALSLHDDAPQQLAKLAAGHSRLLLLEPEDSRVWRMLSAPAGAASTAIAARVEQLSQAGFDVDLAAPVETKVWPASVIFARAGAVARKTTTPPKMAVFGNAALATTLRGDAPPRLIETLGEALAAGVDGELVLVGPDKADAANLAAFSGAIAPLAPALSGVDGRRVWLVCRDEADGVLSKALGGLRRVMRNEGVDARIVQLEPDVAIDRLIAEIAAPDTEEDLLLAENARLAPRLRMGVGQSTKPKGPQQLEIQRPGLLGTLAWETLEPRPVGEGQVAIAVRASGLNFRDVMWALGVLPDEALLDGFSGPSLGLECAGIVTAVGPGVTALKKGDRVAALAQAALATEVVTEASACIPIPASMDFCAAATLPVTTMTVIYALGHLAQLRPGERVLIHGGLGGVGLAAIQYAHFRGAEVFATAGSTERRALLRSLGVKHVFDSRTAAFADEIRAATGGKGVDVVLNSLSGELMQQSLKLMRPFGRFLEIGKRDLFGNSEIGLRPLRHNVTYYAIDADQLPVLAPELAQSILETTGELLAAGHMRGLPYRAYAAADVVDAFRLMQGSGHIGKVVIVPDAPQPAPTVKTGPTFTVRDDRTYLVTGGVGGFGLETAQWLADRGARHLALVSRQGPATRGLEAVLDAFSANGVDAKAYAANVASDVDLSAALDAIRVAQPPIAGVFHAAVVMNDGLLSDLNVDRFNTSLGAKLDGADALDRLTREDPIELFVLYSSISSAIGNPGQGNYVTANAAMEAIAVRRAAAGLPGFAVQWGPISDAGFLTRDERTREIVKRVMASGELTARTALDMLPALIETGLPVVGYAVADWSQIKRQTPLGTTPFMAESADDEGLRASEASIREQIINLPIEEAYAMAEAFLVDEVSEILRLDRNEVDVERPISQLGFDSLMMLELHLAVESRLRVELPLMAVGGGATLRSIAQRVVRGLRSDEVNEDDEIEELKDHVLRHEGAIPAIIVEAAE